MSASILSVAAAFVLLIYIVVKVVINALHLFSKLPGLNFLKDRFSGFLVERRRDCLRLAGRHCADIFSVQGALQNFFCMEQTLLQILRKQHIITADSDDVT